MAISSIKFSQCFEFKCFISSDAWILHSSTSGFQFGEMVIVFVLQIGRRKFLRSVEYELVKFYSLSAIPF